MKKYVESDFFILLDNGECNAKKIKDAYEKLVFQIYDDALLVDDCVIFYSRLIFTKAELLIKEPVQKEQSLAKTAETYMKKLVHFIDAQLDIIKWQTMGCDMSRLKISTNIHKNMKGETTITLQWTGSISDFVEMCYGTYETKVINNGEIDIKQLIDLLSKAFNFPIKNGYNTFREIRKRVGESRTTFLDTMVTKVNERMNDMDNSVYSKKGRKTPKK